MCLLRFLSKVTVFPMIWDLSSGACKWCTFGPNGLLMLHPCINLTYRAMAWQSDLGHSMISVFHTFTQHGVYGIHVTDAVPEPCTNYWAEKEYRPSWLVLILNVCLKLLWCVCFVTDCWSLILTEVDAWLVHSLRFLTCQLVSSCGSLSTEMLRYSN